MTNHKAKETIKTIWERYARTLKLLDKALDELDKKPKCHFDEMKNLRKRFFPVLRKYLNCFENKNGYVVFFLSL